MKNVRLIQQRNNSYFMFLFVSTLQLSFRLLDKYLSSAIKIWKLALFFSVGMLSGGDNLKLEQLKVEN